MDGGLDELDGARDATPEDARGGLNLEADADGERRACRGARLSTEPLKVPRSVFESLLLVVFSFVAPADGGR